MNKKFFQGMETFATVLLIIGIIGALIMLFTVTIDWVPEALLYSTKYEAQFSAVGFASTIECLIGSIALYYVLKGMALMGQKAFKEEKENENTVTGEVVPRPEMQTVEQEAPDNKRGISLLILCGVIVFIIFILAIVFK